MRVTVLPVVTTVSAGAISALLVSASAWDGLKAGLLTALSVIAAAALVRLSRGLPFTNPDHFEADEVEQVTNAVKQLARSLRAFLVVVFAAMVLLVFVKPLADEATAIFIAPAAQAIGRALSFVVGSALAYVLTRVGQIVGSDIGLLDKQAKFMVRAVHRKARDKEEARAEAAGLTPFKTPEGYGRRIQ
jgi:hypothetical protein